MQDIKIKNIYKPINLPFLSTNIKLRTNFNVNNLVFNLCNGKLNVKSNKNDLLVIKSNDSKKKYIVLNGISSHFQNLKLTEGLEVDNFCEIELGVSLEKDSNHLRLILSEYDSNLKKIKMNICDKDKVNLIKIQKNTKFILVILEISGICKIELNGLLLNKRQPRIEHEVNTSKKVDISSQHTNKYKKYFDNYLKSNGIKTNKHLINESQLISSSNGVYYYSKLKYSIAIISDVYMFNFYKDSFSEVYYLTPENYKDILYNNKIDLFFYITSWRGINSDEWKGIKYRDVPKKAFEDIVQTLKEKDIKLIFQTIEDPSNYDYFLPIAKEFDYIFTSDIDMIPKYKKDLNHDNVFYGEYGFNPLVNNPIDSFKYNLEDVFFAGSYTTRYKERCEDNNIIMDTIKNSDYELIIADRNYGTNDKNLQFPSKYIFNVIPAFSDHITLQKIHKLFKYNINLNSIKQSPTMCAMRVYELQAQATKIISNYSLAVFNKFPNISIITSIVDFNKYNLKESIIDNKYRVDTLREVMTDKTSFDILNGFIEKIFNKSRLEIRSSILVIYKGILNESIEISFNNQKYLDKEIVSENDFISNVEFYLDKYNYITWFNSDNSYEKYYLQDMVNAFKYTNCDYITKNSYFTKEQYYQDIEHGYTSYVKSIDKTLFRTDKIKNNIYLWKDNKFKTVDYSCSFYIENGYSIDPFNLNYLEYRMYHQKKTDVYKLSVIIPVYNNGKYLKYTCMNSLQRNEIFNEMEILLIDDGSTDSETKDICQELKIEYSNIKLINLNSSSGSASRPRNIGIEKASAPLITFLDPDNEISPGGYDNLFDLWIETEKKHEEVTIISGYNLKVDKKVVSVAKHTNDRLMIIDDSYERFFQKGKFPTIATQAAIIKKEFLIQNDIRFIEKSAGQDTLFGWELLLKSSKIAFTNQAYLIYYAQREDSITNKIDLSYFDKKIILEKAQIELLSKFDLLDIYKEFHYENFLNNWYLKKLEIIEDKEIKKQALEKLNRICIMYNKEIVSIGENNE